MLLKEAKICQKQITYGEHIDTDMRLREEHGQDMVVYNAFVMPYDATDWGGYKLTHACYATSTWKCADESKPYTHVQGILYDVKRMMMLTANDRAKEIAEIAALIKEHAEEQLQPTVKIINYSNASELVMDSKVADGKNNYNK